MSLVPEALTKGAVAAVHLVNTKVWVHGTEDDVWVEGEVTAIAADGSLTVKDASGELREGVKPDDAPLQEGRTAVGVEASA